MNRWAIFGCPWDTRSESISALFAAARRVGINFEATLMESPTGLQKGKLVEAASFSRSPLGDRQ